MSFVLWSSTSFPLFWFYARVEHCECPLGAVLMLDDRWWHHRMKLRREYILWGDN